MQKTLRVWLAVILPTLGILAALGVAPVVQAAPASQSAAPVGKSQLVQDPSWMAKKLAHQIVVPGAATNRIRPLCVSPCGGPVSAYLDTTVTQNTIEPMGSTPGTNDTVNTNDDAGHG